MIDDLDDDDMLEESVDDEDKAVDDGETGEDGNDNVGDPSVEINVEELISELEAQGFSSKFGNEKDAKHRLEELMERKRARRDLEDFEDYDI